MNISWNDLGNAQKAGDYPFRDGTITVTFAEIAAWHENPTAKFQLMRKHPIQGPVKYVLGKQTDEKSKPARSAYLPKQQRRFVALTTNDPATELKPCCTAQTLNQGADHPTPRSANFSPRERAARSTNHCGACCKRSLANLSRGRRSCLRSHLPFATDDGLRSRAITIFGILISGDERSNNDDFPEAVNRPIRRWETACL